MSVLLEKCTLIPFIWDRTLRLPLLEDLLNSAKEFMLKLVKTTWRCFQASVLNQILIFKIFMIFIKFKPLKHHRFITMRSEIRSLMLHGESMILKLNFRPEWSLRL